MFIEKLSFFFFGQHTPFKRQQIPFLQQISQKNNLSNMQIIQRINSFQYFDIWLIDWKTFTTALLEKSGYLGVVPQFFSLWEVDLNINATFVYSWFFKNSISTSQAIIIIILIIYLISPDRWRSKIHKKVFQPTSKLMLLSKKCNASFRVLSYLIPNLSGLVRRRSSLKFNNILSTNIAKLSWVG